MKKKDKPLLLFIHTNSFSTHELLINPNVFPDLKVDDVVEIFHPPKPPKSQRLFIRVSSTTPMKGVNELSIHKTIAELFNLQSSKEVVINKVKHENATVDFVELSFKDQFISRSDMWRFTLYLANQGAFVKKVFQWNGIRANVEALMHKHTPCRSGVISKFTKFTFRSRSASMFWLFQMSKEMWEYTTEGELYFEKAVNGFVNEVFERWKQLEVKHVLTIIFYARYYKEDNTYLDFYKTVSLLHGSNFHSLIVKLKRAFNTFPRTIQEYLDKHKIIAHNSSSSRGNTLEAISMVFNVFEKHFVNRDLTKTGQFIYIISAGNGVIHVPQDTSLSNIIKRRLMENGISIDLICLSDPPLHGVPLLVFEKDVYRYPVWIHISFYRSKEREERTGFVPICRMPITKQVVPRLPEIPNDIIDESTLFNDIPKQQVKKSNIKKSRSNTNISGVLKPSSKDSVNSFSSNKSKEYLMNVGYSHLSSSWGDHINKQNTYCNPFDFDAFEAATIRNQEEIKKSFVRWTHLYPTAHTPIYYNHDFYHSRNYLEPNWRSLVEPACLPITTEYWPSEMELKAYTNYPTSVGVEDVKRYKAKIGLLLQELVCQRLHHGYQLLLQTHNNDDKEIKEYKLTIHNQFHKISYDPIQPDTISLCRYVPKDKPEVINVEYDFLLWNNFTQSFLPQKTKFSISSDYHWNYLDCVISGYHSDMNLGKLQYRSLQYHFIPIQQPPNDSSLEKYNNKLMEGLQKIIDHAFTKVLISNETISVRKCTDTPPLKREVKKYKLEAKTEDRYEWIYFWHPDTYHPSEAFHIQLYWLVCNGCVVADFMNTIQRRAKQYGFKVIQTPIESFQDRVNLFQDYLLIKVRDVEKAKEILVKELQFWPEVIPLSNCKMFIHCNGGVIVQCSEDGLYCFKNIYQITDDDNNSLSMNTNFNAKMASVSKHLSNFDETAAQTPVEGLLTRSNDVMEWEEATRREIEDYVIKFYYQRLALHNKPFTFADIFQVYKEGVEAIIHDQFTECFEPKDPPRWNFGPVLSILYFMGVFVRYCILFPLRIIIFIVGTLVFGSILFGLHFMKESPTKTKIFRKVMSYYTCVWLVCLCAVVHYHNEPPRRRKNQIFVSNHTSLLDYIILCGKTLFATVGQKHTGLLSFIQNQVMGPLNNIWFERFEQHDRKIVADRIKKHINDVNNCPLLIFPEGVCVNNEYCVMFKKGVFELNAEVCPIAIKYNKEYCDPYWSSKTESFLSHILRLMRSWCVVADVWFLEPQTIRKGETPIEFAQRVKEMIVEETGLISLEWDGYLKYYSPSEKMKRERQKIWAKKLQQKIVIDKVKEEIERPTLKRRKSVDHIQSSQEYLKIKETIHRIKSAESLLALDAIDRELDLQFKNEEKKKEK